MTWKKLEVIFTRLKQNPDIFNLKEQVKYKEMEIEYNEEQLDIMKNNF